MGADIASGLVAETGDTFDLDRIAAVSSSLDLRQPNREALESIVFRERSALRDRREAAAL